MGENTIKHFLAISTNKLDRLPPHMATSLTGMISGLEKQFNRPEYYQTLQAFFDHIQLMGRDDPHEVRFYGEAAVEALYAIIYRSYRTISEAPLSEEAFIIKAKDDRGWLAEVIRRLIIFSYGYIEDGKGNVDDLVPYYTTENIPQLVDLPIPTWILSAILLKPYLNIDPQLPYITIPITTSIFHLFPYTVSIFGRLDDTTRYISFHGEDNTLTITKNSNNTATISLAIDNTNSITIPVDTSDLRIAIRHKQDKLHITWMNDDKLNTTTLDVDNLVNTYTYITTDFPLDVDMYPRIDNVYMHGRYLSDNQISFLLTNRGVMA